MTCFDRLLRTSNAVLQFGDKYQYSDTILSAMQFTLVLSKKRVNTELKLNGSQDFEPGGLLFKLLSSSGGFKFH